MKACENNYLYFTDCYKSHIRLVGGRKKYEGRLEVLYQGRWGTVCNRNFDMNDANVACRQLGFKSAIVVRHNINRYYGRTSAPIYLSRMQCRGSEPSLFHCGHAGINVASGCNHNHDVGVVCLAKASAGRGSICQSGGAKEGQSMLN